MTVTGCDFHIGAKRSSLGRVVTHVTVTPAGDLEVTTCRASAKGPDLTLDQCTMARNGVEETP